MAFLQPVRPCLLSTCHSITPSLTVALESLFLHPTNASTQPQTYASRFLPSNSQTRPLSTLRRERKALKQAPAEFQNGPSENTGGSGTSKTALKVQQEAQSAHAQFMAARGAPSPSTLGGDHVVFTPAPSAPNAYHTPPIFLPRDDVRRKLFESQQKQRQVPSHQDSRTNTSATVTAISTPAQLSPVWPTHVPLPPPVREPYEKKYHLTPAQIEEMRQLRQSDEVTWTRKALAQRFQCSQLFVSLVVQCSPERWRAEKKRYEEIKNEWGPRRRKAREEKSRRKLGWSVEG